MTSDASIVHRPRATLPHTTLPWLDLRDHFVATVGPHSGQGRPFGPLLVLADATFAPRSRFPLHGHAEMEILSVVLEGDLSHHGDQAHGEVVPARAAQLISARDGMRHAEGNDTDRPTRMLQIWLRPDTAGGPPAYFDRALPAGPSVRVAGDAGMPLRCDATVDWLTLAPGEARTLSVRSGRGAYLLALDGSVGVGDARLAPGDGCEVHEGRVVVQAPEAAGLLLIDVPLG